MPNPFPLSDPFATDEHRRWVGRKEANLRRRLLDCECPNRGEVYFHLWCDRLACQEHADALHDCGRFKGKSESSSDEEAVEPEAVVDPPAPRPLTLSPETYRALYGPPEPTGAPILGVTTPGDPWSDIVDTYQHVRDSQGDRQPFFTPALDAEAERLEMEIRLRLNALTPIAADLPAPWVSITDEGIGRFHDDPGAQSVDAALEPDPDNPHQLRHWVRVQELWDELGMDEPDEVECCGHTTPGLLGTRLLFCTQPIDHAGDHRDDAGCLWSELPRHSDSGRWHIIGTGDQVFESPCDCPKPVPWWRRMLPGGTR